MAGVASNEPTQRVSRNNSVVEGAWIGAGVGAAGAGAVALGAKARYNSLDKRQARDLEVLNNQKEYFTDRVEKVHNKFEGKADKIRSKGMDRTLQEMRIDQNNMKRNKRIQKEGVKLAKVNDDLAHVSNLQGLKDRHLYSRMGKGKGSLAILGASAIVGAGTGMLADAAVNRFAR